MNAPAMLHERLRLIMQSDLTAQQKLLLNALAVYLGSNADCWPTVQTLARDCSLSIRQVHKYLKDLKGKGIVKSKRKRNQPARRSINWAALNQDVKPTAHPENRMCSREHPGSEVDRTSGCEADRTQKQQRNPNRNTKRRWFDEFTFGESPEQALSIIDNATLTGEASPDHRHHLLTLWHKSKRANNPGGMFASGILAARTKGERWGTQQDEDAAAEVIRAARRKQFANAGRDVFGPAELPTYIEEWNDD